MFKIWPYCLAWIEKCYTAWHCKHDNFVHKSHALFEAISTDESSISLKQLNFHSSILSENALNATNFVINFDLFFGWWTSRSLLSSNGQAVHAQFSPLVQLAVTSGQSIINYWLVYWWLSNGFEPFARRNPLVMDNWQLSKCVVGLPHLHRWMMPLPASVKFWDS